MGTEVPITILEIFTDGARSANPGPGNMSRKLIISCVAAIAVVVILVLALRGQTSVYGGEWYVIVPAVGVQECSLGMDERDFQRVFGGKRDGDYLIAEDKGVTAFLQSGRIRALFFYFYSKTHNTFIGATDKGIGRDNSIEDVMMKYGAPDRVGESVVSEYGAKPGAHEKVLEYSRLGIDFTFWDGRLADIRTYTKR